MINHLKVPHQTQPRWQVLGFIGLSSTWATIIFFGSEKLMHKDAPKVLIIGSAPDAVRAADWDTSIFSHVIAINNAWRACPSWNCLIFPEDFPEDRLPPLNQLASKRVVTALDFVPIQNDFGGFVYAGGTMSFTAGYWALGAIQPVLIAYIGCDMVYEKTPGVPTHFYGQGTADPLREDVTLQSLEAKSVRLRALAMQKKCAVVNLSSQKESRLQLPRWTIEEVGTSQAVPNSEAFNDEAIDTALQAEKALGYFVPSGRYWEVSHQFSKDKLSEIDNLWLATV